MGGDPQPTGRRPRGPRHRFLPEPRLPLPRPAPGRDLRRGRSSPTPNWRLNTRALRPHPAGQAHHLDRAQDKQWDPTTAPVEVAAFVVTGHAPSPVPAGLSVPSRSCGSAAARHNCGDPAHGSAHVTGSRHPATEFVIHRPTSSGRSLGVLDRAESVTTAPTSQTTPNALADLLAYLDETRVGLDHRPTAERRRISGSTTTPPRSFPRARRIRARAGRTSGPCQSTSSAADRTRSRRGTCIRRAVRGRTR